MASQDHQACGCVRARIVLTDLIVAGAVIAPSVAQQDGTRTYGMQSSVSELAAGGNLSVVAPDIDGVPSVQRQLSLPFAARIGSDSLFIAGDDPVVLRIADQVPALDHSLWTLLLTDTDSTGHVSIQSLGHPPAEIVIPRSWFRSDASTYGVRLDIHQQQSGEFVPERYRWHATARTQIHWTAIFTGNPGAPPPD